MDVSAKMKELGIELPKAPQSKGNYATAVISRGLVYTAGQTPRVDGELEYVGRVGSDLTLEEGYAAARICALNALSAIEAKVGLDRVERFVRANVFVNSAVDFAAQPKVADGASDLLVAIFGEDAGRPVRSSVGVFALPGGAAVEVDLIAEIKD